MSVAWCLQMPADVRLENTDLDTHPSCDMRLSVLVKTYNEATKIAGCLTAVFEALAEWGGEAEVIVADSRSTDCTVGIAARFPVAIVRLDPQEPRGCGIAVQLAFQHCAGDFILLLDGDMELQSGFLKAGFRALDAEPRLGGVAGIVHETEIRNRFDRHRVVTKAGAKYGVQTLLNGGGLYRRAAIEDAGGYAADRNLHAYEEAELGFRLGARGWKLVRLAVPFVRHTGHAVDTWGMIRRMWMSGRAKAPGVLLRSTLGKPSFPRVLRMFIHPWGVIVFWSVFVALVVLSEVRGAIALLAAAAATFLLLVARKRSLADASFSVAMWHVAAAGMLRGFTQRLIPPTQPIKSEVVASPGTYGHVALPGMLS